MFGKIARKLPRDARKPCSAVSSCATYTYSYTPRTRAVSCVSCVNAPKKIDDRHGNLYKYMNSTMHRIVWCVLCAFFVCVCVAVRIVPSVRWSFVLGWCRRRRRASCAYAMPTSMPHTPYPFVWMRTFVVRVDARTSTYSCCDVCYVRSNVHAFFLYFRSVRFDPFRSAMIQVRRSCSFVCVCVDVRLRIRTHRCRSGMIIIASYRL